MTALSHWARHIQNYSDASTLEPHWGYVARVLPCTSDAGSCAYLDVVYHSHDLGMLYIGIIWATIGAIVFIWAIARRCAVASRASSTVAMKEKRGLDMDEPARVPSSTIVRSLNALRSGARHLLLPEVTFRRIFGRTTRLQVLILATLASYLLLWSFLGITYKTWVTPVKSNPGLYNTRTSLGPWVDRLGILAYGMTPLSIMLSSRESILSILTGVPYHHFNFLHRWLGYIIVIQGVVHTLGWTIIEAKLYQPQPTVAQAWIKETYMVWGCVAIILLLLLFVFSLPMVIRRTGYEFFRKAHYILAIVYIGACWGHWAQLKCFLIPSLAIWALDRGARLVRTFLLHYQFLENGTMAFCPAQAKVSIFKDNTSKEDGGTVVRLDFEHCQEPWSIGQHFYLCFTEGSIWQSHPFTPLSIPSSAIPGNVRHSYLFRARGGETRKIANAVNIKAQTATAVGKTMAPTTTTGVILTGPYGQSIMNQLEGIGTNANVLCIAGGTGITFVLPVLLHLVRNRKPRATGKAMPRMKLLWVVRRARDEAWIQAELDELRAAKDLVSVHVYASRDDRIYHEAQSPGQEAEHENERDIEGDKELCPKDCGCDREEGWPLPYNSRVMKRGGRRPDLAASIHDFTMSTSSGPTVVYASGPGEMMTRVRTAVASCNSARKVWRSEESHDVDLICDDRLEW